MAIKDNLKSGGSTPKTCFLQVNNCYNFHGAYYTTLDENGEITSRYQESTQHSDYTSSLLIECVCGSAVTLNQSSNVFVINGGEFLSISPYIIHLTAAPGATAVVSKSS